EAEPHLQGAEQGEWLIRLEADYDNLRAALEWATRRDAQTGLRLTSAVWRFWQLRGDFAEGRSRTTALLGAADPERRTVARAGALNGAGVLAYRQGDYAAARSLYEESLAIRRELDDWRGIAASLNNLGVLAHEEGDYAAARPLYEESLALRRKLDD